MRLLIAVWKAAARAEPLIITPISASQMPSNVAPPMNSRMPTAMNR